MCVLLNLNLLYIWVTGVPVFFVTLVHRFQNWTLNHWNMKNTLICKKGKVFFSYLEHTICSCHLCLFQAVSAHGNLKEFLTILIEKIVNVHTLFLRDIFKPSRIIGESLKYKSIIKLLQLGYLNDNNEVDLSWKI